MQPKHISSISIDIDTFTKDCDQSAIVENDMTEIKEDIDEIQVGQMTKRYTPDQGDKQILINKMRKTAE